MYARVDSAHRMATSRAHTATHLLHAYLADCVPTAKQAGSWVGADELRFDFTSERLLTQEEMRHIEAKVNDAISRGFSVQTKEMPQEEAIKMGAKAFFGDKYGTIVRVVLIQDESDEQSHVVSMELCGGVHVKNTSQIGAFVIVGQEAVASGVKRVTCYTGPKVIQHYHEKAKILKTLREKLEATSDVQVGEKLEKILKELATLHNHVLSVESHFVAQLFTTILAQQQDYAFMKQDGIDITIDIQAFPGLEAIARDVLLAKCKEVFSDHVVLLYKHDGSFMLFSPYPTRSAKQLATQKGWKGGGNDQVFQGKDMQVVAYVRSFKEN